MDLVAKWCEGGIYEVCEWGLRMIVGYSDVVLVILRLCLYKVWYSVNYGFGKSMFFDWVQIYEWSVGKYLGSSEWKSDTKLVLGMWVELWSI